MSLTPDLDRPAHRNRRSLLSRTALCGVLAGAGMFQGQLAYALPTGGLSQVNAGGGQPVITTNGAQMDVRLNGARTLIDWNTFDVGAAEAVTFNFDAKSWIVLNRIGNVAPTKLDGTIQGRVGSAAGGNIWFTTRAGYIIGGGAKFDAGGLLFAIGNPDAGSFLDPSKNMLAISGSDNFLGAGFVMKSGARIDGHGGLVAVIAPSVVTEANTSVNSDGGGSVMFGAADSYTLRLAQGVAGDLDLVDFLVAGGSAGSAAAVALDLQNSTTANNVYVAVVSRAGVASAVVNLEGMITAQAANADGGDIVLSAGGGIVNRAPGPQLFSTPADIYLNKATASRDLKLATNGQVFGRPWARPPKPPEPEPEVTLSPEDLCGAPVCICDENGCRPDDGGHGNGNGNGFGNGYGNGFGNGNGNGYCDPCVTVASEDVFLGALLNPSIISGVTVGRDARLVASKNIDLGRLSAGRDVSIEAPTLFANQLGAGRDLTIVNTGELRVSETAVGRNGAISAQGVTMDGLLTGNGRVAINSGGDILIGDGQSIVSGGGVVDLTAARNITVASGSARLGTVQAGLNVNLRGGALTIDKISAQGVFAQSQAVNVGEVNSDNDVYIFTSQGDAVVGKATAGDDVFVVASSGTASLGAATLTGRAGDAVTIGFAGNPDTAGNGRLVRVESASGDVRLGLGTGAVTGATAVTAQAGRDAFVDVAADLPGAFQMRAGRDASLRAPTASLSAIQAGRDIALNATSGNFTSTQTLTATRNISISAAGDLRLADVRADSGSISLGGRTVSAGAVTASEDLVLRAPGGAVTLASFRAGRDLIIEGNTLSLGTQLAPIGRDFSLTTTADFTSATDLSVARNLTLVVGGNANVRNVTAQTGGITIQAGSLAAGVLTAPTAVTLNVAGAANVGGLSTASAVLAGGALNLTAGTVQNALVVDTQGRATLGTVSAGSVRVVAGDLDVTGTLTAPTIQIESRAGALRLGGAASDGAPASGLWLDNAEFGRLRASTTVRVYAGPTAGTARGALTVQNLDINPAFTPQVSLFAGRTQQVLVQGTAAPTASGGALRIGDSVDANWKPDSILITGALGSATFQNGAYSNIRAFSDLRLVAQNDILMGSQRFIGLIQGAAPETINIGQELPDGVAPLAGEQNKVFVAASRLEVSGEGKVVQQNTSSNLAVPVGLFLGGSGNATLVIDPPKVVELYGAFTDADGRVINGAAGGQAIPFMVVDANGNPIPQPAGSTYRFNSCDVGTGNCSGLLEAPMMVISSQQSSPILNAGDRLGGDEPIGSDLGADGESDSNDTEDDEDGEGDARNVPPGPPPLLGVAPPNTNDIASDPVTAGAGSEEIWRERRQKQP